MANAHNLSLLERNQIIVKGYYHAPSIKLAAYHLGWCFEEGCQKKTLVERRTTWDWGGGGRGTAGEVGERRRGGEAAQVFAKEKKVKIFAKD